MVAHPGILLFQFAVTVLQKQPKRFEIVTGCTCWIDMLYIAIQMNMQHRLGGYFYQFKLGIVLQKQPKTFEIVRGGTCFIDMLYIATQMNMQHSSGYYALPVENGYSAAEATKNFCCMKFEGAVNL